MGGDPFRGASAELALSTAGTDELAHPFVTLLPIAGASVSTFGPLLGSETVSATDLRVRRVDELQFDLGEGPCWDAISARTPVLEPDFSHRDHRAWPAFSDAVQSEYIGALFAFPLVLGTLEIGAVDLYAMEPLALTPQHRDQTVALANIVSRILLRRALEPVQVAEGGSPLARRLIHQATGMVMARLGVSSDDAYLLIQAHAFSENQSMHEVATAIVERRLRFTPDTPPTLEVP